MTPILQGTFERKAVKDMATDTELLFLCGFPSSGTDLLKNILNAHPDIYIGGEFPFLPSLAENYGPVVRRDAVGGLIEDLKEIDVYHNFRSPDLAVSSLPAECSVADIFSRMLSADKRKWKGNKTPQNTENIDKLKKLFPRAKFILIIRDIRDVALSWENKWGKDALLCASKWDLRMRRGANAMQQLEGDCLIVKYESLLDDLKATAQKICSFLQIEFHPDMLEFDKHVDEIIDGKLNYGKPVLADNHGKWHKQMDRSKIKRIEEIAWKSMTLFGYPVEAASGYRPLTTRGKVLGLARDCYALVFVGNRAIKDNSLWYRFGTISHELKKRLLFRSGVRE